MSASLKVTQIKQRDASQEKPEIVALGRDIKFKSTGDNSWQLSFRVDKDILGVAAHFPQMQLIAGYMQLRWVAESLSQTSSSQRISRIVDIKFSGQIPVPSLIRLECELSEDLSMMKFNIFDEEGLKTKGRVAVESLNENPNEDSSEDSRKHLNPTPNNRGQDVC